MGHHVQPAPCLTGLRACAVCRYHTESQDGKEEEKQMRLGEDDELWVELRHAFIAEVGCW
jgi:hypothetical protein